MASNLNATDSQRVRAALLRRRLHWYTVGLGFDRSTLAYGRDEQGRFTRARINVKCGQCQMLAINGVATHEQRCPNQTHECKGCSARVGRAGSYCQECR